MLICETCDKQFVNRLGLNSHLRSQIHQGTSKKPRVACSQCDKTFSCRQNMNRHTREIHDYIGHKSVKQCSLCPFKTKFILQMSLHFKKCIVNSSIEFALTALQHSITPILFIIIKKKCMAYLAP